MNNFIFDGEVLKLTAPYAVLSGGGALVGNIFGVATADVANAVPGQFMTKGVFDLTKAAGAVTAGDRIYWDNTNKVVTTVASGNSLIGRATQDQLSGDATARVVLNPGGSINMSLSAEQTGTGSNQNIAHNLGAIPRIVIAIPTDTAPATTGAYTATMGTHTTTNAVVNVTTGKKYMVLSIL